MRRAKPKPEEMREWLVPVQVTLRGLAWITAPTAEAASEAAEGGNFEVDGSFEMCDWERTGAARETR